MDIIEFLNVIGFPIGPQQQVLKRHPQNQVLPVPGTFDLSDLLRQLWMDSYLTWEDVDQNSNAQPYESSVLGVLSISQVQRKEEGL